MKTDRYGQNVQLTICNKELLYVVLDSPFFPKPVDLKQRDDEHQCHRRYCRDQTRWAPNTVHSCSHNSVATNILNSEWLGSVIPLSKTCTLLGVHSQPQMFLKWTENIGGACAASLPLHQHLASNLATTTPGLNLRRWVSNTNMSNKGLLWEWTMTQHKIWNRNLNQVIIGSLLLQ